MITIHGMADSGNCYKPRLLMALLGRPFRHLERSSRDGSTRQADFLALNVAGQVPLLELDDGRVLAESNAILHFLAEGTPFLPDEPFARATVLRWMFFEQNAHEPMVAVRRSLLVYPERREGATADRMAQLLSGGTRALEVLDRRLDASPFLAGPSPTVADVALYPYTASAPEGGFDLAPLGALRSWLTRIEGLPGFRPRDWLPG